MHINGYNIRRARGFTLTEILITLVIIGFIGALGVPMIGQKKYKRPVELKTDHGTMECFWEGDQLKQYIADNDTHKSGDVTNVSGGSCTFTVPQANMFILQAIGSGGMGARNDSELDIDYTTTTTPVVGWIPTDSSFLTSMTNAPEWVQREWNNQWSESSKFIEYTLVSPIGKAGDSACAFVTKTSPAYCTNRCNGVHAVCPSECTEEYIAKGGDSGQPRESVIRARIRYHKDGLRQAVEYSTTTAQTRLAIGENYLRLGVSGSGGNANIQHPDYLTYILNNGTNGADSVGTLHSADSNNFWVVGSQLRDTRQRGETACSETGGKTGVAARSGSITASPSSIEYRATSLAVQATFGPAGLPGETDSRIVERLPFGARIRLIPSRNGSDSRIQIQRNGEWVDLVKVSSGADGIVGTQVFPIGGEDDLPFPKTYDHSKFLPHSPEIKISTTDGYQSYILNHNIMPGMPGAGVYKMVDRVEGNPVHIINNIQTNADSAETETISKENVNCLHEGWIPDENNVCGQTNSPGTAGAVIISW